MITKNIATYQEMIDSLDPIILSDEEKETLLVKYNYILAMLDSYIPSRKPEAKIRISLHPFHKAGNYQMIANADVSNFDLPERNCCNWHLQNTSQWLFGMGFLFDLRDRKFSIHT